MSLKDPNIQTSEKFSEVLEEGHGFLLRGARLIENVTTQEYGTGTMVILDVTLESGEEKSLGIWGQYIVEQVKDANDSDFPALYMVTREVVDGYSTRPVKLLKPVSESE